MWLSATDIRNKFNVAANRFDTQIEAALRSAGLIIQRGVEAATYAEAIASTPPTDPDELQRYNSVVEAHSYLTMWVFVGNASHRLTDGGFIKSQQDSASPAMSSRIVTNSYFSPKDLAEMRKNYLAEAQFWLGPYGTIEIDATPDVVAVTSPTSTAVSVIADW
jgi:hypothetical protein